MYICIYIYIYRIYNLSKKLGAFCFCNIVATHTHIFTLASYSDNPFQLLLLGHCH